MKGPVFSKRRGVVALIGQFLANPEAQAAMGAENEKQACEMWCRHFRCWSDGSPMTPSSILRAARRTRKLAEVRIAAEAFCESFDRCMVNGVSSTLPWAYQRLKAALGQKPPRLDQWHRIQK